MKILYLFNRIRVGVSDKIAHSEDHDGHFFGMFRLRQHGIRADYLELEQFLPRWLARWLRQRVFNVHYIHLPLFFKMRNYDAVFTSTAMGTLFLKTMFGLKRPKWIILDYGLRGMISQGATLKQKALRFMIGRADGVITISPGEKQAMDELFPQLAGTTEFLPLGVDTLFFSPDINVTEQTFIFSPGRDPGRDLRLLVEATAGLVLEVKITARPGSLAKISPLPDHIKCYDFSPTELRQQYRLAKLVVLPLDTSGGLNDAMGCSTLVESMAMGKAVIATHTETMAAYITHGYNGWLVPAGNSAALRIAVTKLLNDDTLRRRLGKAAREFVIANCSADIFAQRLADYFKKNI